MITHAEAAHFSGTALTALKKDDCSARRRSGIPTLAARRRATYRLTLEKLGGSILEWPRWIALFKALVHNRSDHVHDHVHCPVLRPCLVHDRTLFLLFLPTVCKRWRTAVDSIEDCRRTHKDSFREGSVPVSDLHNSSCNRRHHRKLPQNTPGQSQGRLCAGLGPA